MKINEVIRKLRQIRGLTQENLADSVGVNITTMNRYESDEGNIPNDKLEKIAKALKVAVSDLYHYQEEPSLLNEPSVFGYQAKKQVTIMVHLDGSDVTLKEWFGTLTRLNAAL